MSRYSPNALLVPVTAALLGLAGSGHLCPIAAQASGAPTAMQMRGHVAMGVDQFASSHVFDALTDGGRIELQMHADDPEAIAQIRHHLQQIAHAFASGDFTTPAFVHMQDVPGAAVMAANRAAITYTYQELPRGGEVRITSSNAAAIHAIHEFMAFQRSDHGAGGMEHPDHGGMQDMAVMHDAMHGGAAAGADHAANGADMELVHALLEGHAAIDRSVINLPNGVRAVTESDDPALAALIKEHVASMLDRLTSGEVFNISSPTIPVLFANAAVIRTRVEQTAKGVVFTQTSDVAELVAVIQAHALEVDALVEEGMAAMMRGMMQRGGPVPSGTPRP